MPKCKSKSVASERCFTSCVPPWPRYLLGGDTHDLCVVCLGAEHARAALEGAACHDCELLPLSVLRSRLAIFDESGQVRDPAGSGSAIADAQRRLLSWGSQVDLAEGSETGSSLTRSSSTRSTAPSQGSEVRPAVFFPPERRTGASSVFLWGGWCDERRHGGDCGLATAVPRVWGACGGCDSYCSQTEHRMVSRETGR